MIKRVVTPHLKVLHLEDDANDVFLLQRAFEKSGVKGTLRSVGDARGAMAYLAGEANFQNRERHPFPNLILLDLKMPRMNGFEFLEWIKLKSKWRYLPIIVWTSSSQFSDIEKAYGLGAVSYLVKPVELERLIEYVSILIEYWEKCSHCVEPPTGS